MYRQVNAVFPGAFMCRDGKEGVGARLVRKRHWQLSLTSCLFWAAMFIIAGVKGRGRAHFNLYSAVVRVRSNT